MPRRRPPRRDLARIVHGQPVRLPPRNGRGVGRFRFGHAAARRLREAGPGQLQHVRLPDLPRKRFLYQPGQRDLLFLSHAGAAPGPAVAKRRGRQHARECEHGERPGLFRLPCRLPGGKREQPAPAADARGAGHGSRLLQRDDVPQPGGGSAYHGERLADCRHGLPRYRRQGGSDLLPGVPRRSGNDQFQRRKRADVVLRLLPHRRRRRTPRTGRGSGRSTGRRSPTGRRETGTSPARSATGRPARERGPIRRLRAASRPTSRMHRARRGRATPEAPDRRRTPWGAPGSTPPSAGRRSTGSRRRWTCCSARRVTERRGRPTSTAEARRRPVPPPATPRRGRTRPPGSTPRVRCPAMSPPTGIQGTGTWPAPFATR